MASERGGVLMEYVLVTAIGARSISQDILSATFQYPTGGAEAIAHALKILAGEKVPKDITLGSRLFTKANAAQGGEPLP